MDNQLLEQYKLYVEMADRVSQRRQSANRFYISLLTALGGIYLLFYENSGNSPNLTTWAFLTIIISLLWWLTINSYRQLNTGKFMVIHEMEKQLPYACFDKEWEFLGRGKKNKLYRQLTKVEGYIPIIIILSTLIYLITNGF